MVAGEGVAEATPPVVEVGTRPKAEGSPPFHFFVRYVRFLLLMGCDRFPNLGDGPRAPRHTPNQPEQSREFGRRRWSGLGGP